MKFSDFISYWVPNNSSAPVYGYQGGGTWRMLSEGSNHFPILNGLPFEFQVVRPRALPGQRVWCDGHPYIVRQLWVSNHQLIYLAGGFWRTDIITECDAYD